MYGEMDEEMEDFTIGDYLGISEVDFDYEFDASRFIDFTRPESSAEADEAERWFESATSYPPSPFVLQLKWREEIANASLMPTDTESMESSSNNLDYDTGPQVHVGDGHKQGPKSCNDISKDIRIVKTKSKVKSSKMKSSTLMKPTASHLAKLNRAEEVQSSRYLGRSKKPSTKIDEQSSLNPLGVDRDATKRQKLENGYLCKVAHLKHHSQLLHKLSKFQRVDASMVSSRLKVTIPREPDLETAHRAQRYRFRHISESGEHGKSKVPTFKARPLNRKILKAPSLPPQKKSRPLSPLFQVFHLKTTERAMKHSSANALNGQNCEAILKTRTTNSERLNSEDACKNEKFGTQKVVKVGPLSKKDLKLPNDNKLSYNPPIDLFNKLSLKSEILEHNSRSLPTKGSKENVPGSCEQELRSQRYETKQNRCGRKWRIPEIGQ